MNYRQQVLARLKDGANISNGINSGYDLNNWRGIWLAHELGHALSLPDLYDFGNGDIHRHVGTFGLMGLISGEAPGYFAFEESRKYRDEWLNR